MSFYIGQLVVLRSRWNIHSFRVGIIIKEDELSTDVVLVMWTDKCAEGIKLKYHLKDAVLPVTDKTMKKINERKLELL